MKVALLKLSGKRVDEFTHDDKWISVIECIARSYDGLIMVHGAGSLISQWSDAFSLKPVFIEGLRVTCEKTMEIVAAVQSGLVNARLVSHMQKHNLSALGLTGIDRGLFVAEYNDRRLGFVGTPVIASDPSWVLECAVGGTVPVFSSICRDSEGNLMNVNADLFAESLSKALCAHTVLFVSDIDAVMINGTKKHMLTEHEILHGIANGSIKDGMIPKMQSALQLLKGGVANIWIGSDLHDLDFSYDRYNFNNRGTWIAAQQQ